MAAVVEDAIAGHAARSTQVLHLSTRWGALHHARKFELPEDALRPFVRPSSDAAAERPWLFSPCHFLPIKDELAVPLEGSKAHLKSSQHGYRDLSVTTFLKRSCNDLPLANNP